MMINMISAEPNFDNAELILLRNALVVYRKYLDQEKPHLYLSADRLLARINELLLSEIKEINTKWLD
jgi:hypothetical protein